MNRRRFLAAAGAAIAASTVDARLFAAARFRRHNLGDQKASAKAVDSYKKAVAAMLALPPESPHNWYRNALIHMLDCPHGNWWFLPWHRGYLGWFEQTCRAVSKDPDFALPYWDWTATTKVPDVFYDGVLNPVGSQAYLASYAAFEKAFRNPLSAFWKSLSAQQLKVLTPRFQTFDEFWDSLGPAFSPRPQARGLKKNQRFDSSTAAAVAIRTIRAALAPTAFTDFGSAKAAQHSDGVGNAILEGQPHNNVHGAVGGFMGDFLSPVDPVFFAHHANIDRLWDAWTRKQQKLNLPTLPPVSDLGTWSAEPFLFFVDAGGKPETTHATAGAYATIGAFDYDYAPGSGEDVVTNAVPAPTPGPSFEGTVSRPGVGPGTPGVASAGAFEPLRQANTSGRTVFARITLRRPPNLPRGTKFHVTVNAPDGTTASPETPGYAGTFRFFGTPHHPEGPVYITIRLNDAVAQLGAAGAAGPATPLRIQVHLEAPPQASTASADSLTTDLLAVQVGTF